MRSIPRPLCLLCGAAGLSLYQDLNDRLFSAPGEWSVSRCPAPDCGLLWLDPMPREEDLGMAYRDYLTHQQTARPRISRMKRAYLNRNYGYPKSPSLRTRVLDTAMSGLFQLRIRRRIELDGMMCHLKGLGEGRKVLDVGCGSGDGMVLLSLSGWHAQGVEFDPKAATIARSKGFTVHLGSLAEQQFAGNTFDAVVMSHVIEHVAQPLEVIAECHRILKPGGRLVLLTPNAHSLGHRLCGSSWLALDPPRHLHIFTPRAIREAALRAGFEVDVSTSVRSADHIVLHSHEIQKHGHVSEATKPGWGWRRVARTLQMLELLVLQFNPNAGEELVLRGRKHA